MNSSGSRYERRAMKAKEYLRQVIILDTKINQRLQEADALYSTITGRALSYNRDKVQTSVSRLIEEKLDRYNDLQREIDEMIDELILIKHQIINEIHSIDAGENTEVYIKILYRKYIDKQSFKQIAKEIGYDYKWLCKLHGRALQCFQKQILDNTTKHEL